MDLKELQQRNLIVILNKLSTLRNKADKAYQEAGMKNNPKCLLCGKLADCIHHFIPKSVCSALRYELKNGIPICTGCHNRLHHSGDPEYEHKIIKIKGENWYEDLKRIRRDVEIKESVGYYKQIILALKNSF